VPRLNLATALRDLSQEQLIDVVLTLTRRDPKLERQVRLSLTAHSAVVSELARAVQEVLKTRRYLDYRDMIEYAQEARPLVEALAEAAEGPVAAQLVPVAEKAVGHIVKCLLNGDDSSGAGGDVAMELLRVHARAAAVGRPDPERLLRWLIRFTFEDQDFFNPDVRDYAPALGEAGIEAYRAEVLRRAAAEPEDFATQHALGQLALLDRDADAIVRTFGGRLEGVHRYVAVAEAFLEIADEEAALRWALRGSERPATWQSRPLYDVAAKLLAGRGDGNRVVDVREQCLRALPDPTSYAALRDAAEAVGRWPQVREEALAIVQASSVDAYLQVLLLDGDPDRAWEALQTWGPRSAPESTVQQVATARAETHPADAVPHYQRAIDQTLPTADRSAYRDAARLLVRLRTLEQRAGRPEAFDDFLAGVVEANRRRPSFFDELRKAGLRRSPVRQGN